jgi:hypothetical protein
MTRKAVYAIKRDPSKVYKRPLSAKGSAACEDAHLPVCICRCGGVLHGKSHTAFQAAIQERLTDGATMTRGESVELATDLLIDELRAEVTPTPLPCLEDATPAPVTSAPARDAHGRYIKKEAGA